MRKEILMTAEPQWVTQYRINGMKERRAELERFIDNTKREVNVINNLELFKKHPQNNYVYYFFEIIFLFLLRLDMIVGFYINRFQMNRIVKKAKNEIRGLNLSIRIETKLLKEREKYDY